LGNIENIKNIMIGPIFDIFDIFIFSKISWYFPTLLIGRKSRNFFYTPPVFSALAGCDPVGICEADKTRMIGYRMAKKTMTIC